MLIDPWQLALGTGVLGGTLWPNGEPWLWTAGPAPAHSGSALSGAHTGSGAREKPEIQIM